MTSSVTGISEPTVSDSSALRSPRSESATGCSPRARSRSSAWAAPSSSLGEAEHVDRLIAALELALSDLEQIRHRREPLLRAVVQVAADAPALGIGGLDHARARASQRGRLLATLELGRRPRREDAHRGDVVVLGRHRPSVHHGHVAEMRAVGRAQADREVALEAHVDRRLGLGEALRQRLRERDDRPLHDQRARLAARVVLERLVHPVALVPAAHHPHVLARRVRGLCDEGELRAERQRDVTDQAAKELVPDRTRGSLGNGAKQVPAAELHAGWSMSAKDGTT